MAGPVKVKVSGSVEQGLQELTDAEIRAYTGQVITEKYASVDGTSSLRVRTSGSTPSGFTDIGTFTDRKRDDSVGTHPTTASLSTVNTYTVAMGTSTNSGTFEKPMRMNADGELVQSTDAEIDTEILDKVILSMVQQDDESAGLYWLSASAPSGGTWAARATISDTQVDGTTVTKTLWQKTAATTNTTRASGTGPVKKLDDGSLQEMSDTEIEALYAPFVNRIQSTGIGKYQLASTTPGGGTWQQLGETLTDQAKDTATYAYAGSYAGTYDGTYVGSFTGAYTGSYTGSYTGAYTGNYTGAYSGAYARWFTGYYSGTYNGSFQSYYGGFTGAIRYTNYTGAYTGAYQGFFTGSYSGTYAGTYGGTYAGTYGGTYAGTYDGSFTGSYTGSYTGAYSGVTIVSSSSTQESKQLFVRTA